LIENHMRIYGFIFSFFCLFNLFCLFSFIGKIAVY